MAEIDWSRPIREQELPSTAAPVDIDWSKPISEQTVNVVPPPAKPVTRSPSPSFGQKLQTGIRGFGQGITAGVIQYPQAALKSLVTGEPVSASLEDLRAENQRLAAQQPGSWYTGNLLGAGGLGYATMGGSMPSQIGLGALTGAVGGYTERESVADALTGAGIGGALSGLAGKIGNMFASKAAKSEIKEFIDTWGKQPIETQKALKEEIYKRPVNKASEVLTPPTEAEVRTLYKNLYGRATPEERAAMASEAPSELKKALVEEAKKQGGKVFKAALPYAGTTAAGALTGSYYDNAGLGALIGAAGPASLKYAIPKIGAKFGAELPQEASPFMIESGKQALMRPNAFSSALQFPARLATQAVTPEVSEQVTTPRSRLQQLADDFRVRNK